MTAILEQLAVYVREVPNFIKKTVQVVKSTTTKASHNKLMQNIKNSYKTVAALAVNIATSTKNHTDHTKQQQTSNRNTSTYPGT